VGTIDFDETTVRDINIKVPGWIEAVHVDYLGAEVSAGDPLFEFYSPELYAAQEEFLLAHRNRDQIGADFVPKAAEGAQDMLASARTRLEYFDVTPGQIDALAERGTPAKTMTMYSPFQGVVIAKNANEGLRVDQGTQVYRIADLSKVWGMVTLYEYQLPYVQVGQQAKMTLPYIPGHTFNGEVIYIYPYLDKATRQVNVRLEFDNHDGLLKPGMYANVELENRLAAERVLAPRSAIIDTGERQVAFVSLGDGKFEPRDIRMGIETLEGQVEILDGLRAGEMVVTSGQFLLDSEAKIREGLAKMIRGDLASGQEAVVASAGASELSSLPDDAATALRMLLGDYFTIGDTLAGDSADGLDTHARNVARAVDDMLRVPIPEDSGFWNRHDEAATIRGKALELIEVNDIEAARLVFADLSVALSTLTRATGIPSTYDAEVHELHCPMYREGQGGSIWLQPKGSVRNPFYGAMMLECFDERSVIPVTGATASPSAAEESSEPDAGDADRTAITPATIAIDSAVQLQLDAIHTAYVSFHDLLTKDETDGLRRALEVIAGGAAVFSSAADPDLKAFGERLTTATHGSVDDLESARAVFEQVSTVLMELWAVAPPSTSVAPVVYQVYCPMVKKSWLQTDREVANPYAPYMLRCGSIKGVVAGTAPGGESR
ncbi:MAG: efflux RND transporter periplasmic adaptor subunit, partial [Acidimicrobiia bacterium]|nr:efflux RND transporter periplasmic adaptor subunit [Acidimicrobiia bacterium]